MPRILSTLLFLFLLFGGLLPASSDSLFPGFDELENDSLRLRQVIDFLIGVSQEGDPDTQQEKIREAIRFCEARDFKKGSAAAHSTLHNHFSFTSQKDSAFAEKELIVDSYLSHLSCQNQVHFWVVSGTNLLEAYQTDGAIEEFFTALALADSCDLPKLTIYSSLASVQSSLGKHEESIRYLKLGREEMKLKLKNRRDTINYAVLLNNLSLEFDNAGEEDSAWHYIQLATALHGHPAFRIRMAVLAMDNGQYDLAREQQNLAEEMIGDNPYVQSYRNTLLQSKVVLAFYEGRDEEAKKLAQEALELAIEGKSIDRISAAYGLKIKSLLGGERFLVDSLFLYKKKQQSEAVVEATVKYETLTEAAQKEQEILQLNSELKDQTIRTLRWRNYLVYGGIGIACLILLVIVYFRRRQARARLEVEKLRKQAIQLQMNPHFFFNSLNSINLYIAKNEKEKASEYLVSFAKMMRQTLENSQEDAVFLEKEIEFLRNYLSLEQLRMRNFAFRFEVEEGLGSCRIPALMIQPLVENSLQHGFKDIDYEGSLLVRIRRTSDFLQVEVIDNGWGHEREGKKSGDSDHHSFALSILRKRLRAYAPQLDSLRFEKGMGMGDNPGTKVSFQVPIF